MFFIRVKLSTFASPKNVFKMIEADINEIDIVKAEKTKIHDVDFNNINFGRVFTDHMFVCDFIDGKWQQPKIMPYQAMTIDPSARVFHYGQAVFEGMKAYKDDNGSVFLFRPEDNFEYYAYVLFYVDDVMAIHHNGISTLQEIDKFKNKTRFNWCSRCLFGCKVKEGYTIPME